MTRIISGLVLAALAASASAAPLTLGVIIRQALEVGFDMELQEHDLAIAREEIPWAQSEFDPRLIASANKSVFRQKGSSSSPPLRSEGIETHIGLLQRFAVGADVAIGANVARSESNPAFVALNPAYASTLTIAVRQPLMRGFGRTVNRAALRGAELDLEDAWRNYQAQALDVIHATEIACFQLVAAREEAQVVRSSLMLAEKLLHEARGRRRAGMATKLDELQARVGLANAERAVIESENEVKGAEDVLRALIGRFDLGQPLELTISQDAPVSSPYVEESYARALRAQPELLRARAALYRDRLDLSLAHDQRKPAVDLSIAMGLNGDDVERSKAFDRVFARDDNSWQAGITFSYPLGQAGAKARYRQALVALRRSQLLVQQLEQHTLVRVRSAVRDIETGMESIELATESRALSEQQYEHENARFRAGLSTSRRVLEAQIDLERARVALVRSQSSLHVAFANLRRLEGSAIDHYGLSLPSSRPSGGRQGLASISPR